jgi:RecA-family ATPase
MQVKPKAKAAVKQSKAKRAEMKKEYSTALAGSTGLGRVLFSPHLFLPTLTSSSFSND